MKASSYNWVINKPEYSYWYNTINKSFFRLSLNLGKKLQNILTAPKIDLTSLPDFLLNKLTKGGFVIDDDADELYIIRKYNKNAIDKKNYFMIVLPTLDCNYHCWYCIQSHVQSKMSNNVVERIKNHIDYMINVEGIEALQVDWFGGEPFMYFHEIIKPISEYARTECIKSNIPFFNSSTTNGYFLTDSVIENLAELDFRHFQITLDGNKEFHDKVKFQNGCDSTFDHVLNNINKLLSVLQDTKISLRINYTHKNLNSDIVEQVNKHIDLENRSRIHIVPRKVWQENIDRNFNNILSLILEEFKKSGYNIEYWNPVTNFIPCYANKKYYNAINYNGNIVKCTACNDLYEGQSLGKLLEDGSIEWNGNLEKEYRQPTFENPKCLKCIKLPICMGLCPRDHINGAAHCKEDVMDTPFNDSIVNFIDKIYDDIC